MKKNTIVEHQNTCSVPYKPETVMGTGVKRQYVGAGKVHNQQHNKTLNPKFSALIDTIVDGEHSPKKKKKTLPINELFPVKKTLPRDDLTPKVDVDDDDIDPEQTDLAAIDVDDDNETEDDSDDSNDSDNDESFSGI